MTAPRSMFDAEPYNLHTKITKTELGKYVLEAERVYEYKNVWKVKNAFEKFFRDEYDYKTGKDIKPEYYRKVKIEGDMENMQYCEIRIWENLSLSEAKEMENDMKKSEQELHDFHKKWRENVEDDLDIELPF